MFSSLVLETMNSVRPELTWKSCTKGRRSRKSVARNFGSPKRVMDTLVSGSDKVDGSGRGHATSCRKEKIPIKKRRRLNRRSSSMNLNSHKAFSEENEQPLYPFYSSEDLYGIELLATVASMDDDFMNAGLEDLPESSLALSRSGAAAFTSQSEELPKHGTDKCDKTLLGGNRGCAFLLPESATSSETLCISSNQNKLHKVNRQHWDLNIQMDAWPWVEPFDLEVNGFPSEKDSEDQKMPEPIGKTDECPDVHGRSTNQVLGCESSLETAKQVTMTEAMIDRSHMHKLDCSGMLVQEEQVVESTGTTAELQDEVLSSNTILCRDTLAFDRVYRSNQDVTLCDPPTIEVSVGTQCNDRKDSVLASGESFTTISMENVTPCTFRSHPDDNESNSHEAKLLLIPKQVDNDETHDEAKEGIMSGGRAQCADPSLSVGNNDLALADFPHYDQGHMAGDDLTRHVEMYDSSYEDGELRGSFLYSWEDNAMENEFVDYESDGRNVDGSSADDHAGYETLEGGHPGNNAVSGKVESNAGSGTTVEHCSELINEENDHCMKRRQLSDRRDLVVGKSTDTDGYTSKFVARQSYIDSLDPRNPYSIQGCRSHRYNGSFSRTAREVTQERYQGRRRPISFGERDGVDLDQWTHLASKKRFYSRYQGAEGHGYSRPRLTISNASECDRLDDVDHRKTANKFSMSCHRPFTRKSPLDKNDSLGISRRTPFGQGSSRHKSRGCYSQRASRDFGEHFGPPPEYGTTHLTCLPRYSKGRERNFSPDPVADTRFNERLGRSRSRSRTPPRVWQSRRDQSLYVMKHSRSQDLGYKVRAGRIKVPFSKSAFASKYEDNYYYSSPSHRRFSPIRRMVDDRGPNGADKDIRRWRSPARYQRHNSKFDTTGFRGVKDEHYPVGRFSFKPSSGREAKFESISDDGCDENGEVKPYGNDGNTQSFRANAARDNNDGKDGI